MTSNQTVALKVDVESLVNNLKFAFTNQTTFLAELMQNARRAGATGISFRYSKEDGRLIVRDDGCGIQDLQTILTIAKSGWDKEVMDDEHPYGMGFMAALYTAERITIRSHGKRISFLRDDVLAFGKIAVEEAEMCPGMEIILEGISINEAVLERTLRDYAMGFPIPVFYNDKELERPHKPNGGLWFEDIEGSLVCFDRIDATPNSYGAALGSIGGLFIYLNGIQVCSLISPAWPGGVVHLNPEVFFGRAPYRTRVVNEEEMLGWVRRVFNERWVARIHELKRDLSPEDFAARMYSTLKYWDCLDLLNDVPFVPPQVLGVPDIYPIVCNYYDNNHHFVNRPVPRKELEAGARIVEVDLYPYMEESFHAPMYVMAHHLASEDEEQGEAVYVLLNSLPQGHWVNDFLVQVAPEDVTLELGGKIELDCYSGSFTTTNVAICDKVVLNGPLGEVEMSRPFFFVGRDVGSALPEGSVEDGAIVMPSGCSDHRSVVRQLSDFVSDPGGFNEQALAIEQSRFELSLLARTQKGEPEVLKRLLQEVRYNLAALRGKSFRVTFSDDPFDHEGGITVEPID